MLMLDWNPKLKADGVKVWSVSPGFLITGLGEGAVSDEVLASMGAMHPREGGKFLRQVVEGEREDHG